jgi:hypothetical protein
MAAHQEGEQPLREPYELRADAQSLHGMRTAIRTRDRKKYLRNAWGL